MSAGPAAGESRPFVSLIIAVYNRPDFLEKVFLSLVNQTLRDFETVVADDGSDPQIAELVKQYSPRFARPIVHAWHQHRGFRKTAIANRAVASSSSEYLAFIDGDCILHRRFLENHVRYRRRGVVLGGRRVMLDKFLTDKLTNDDVLSGRIERPWFWWNHCDPSDRKHGLYAPALQRLSNLRKKGYSMYGSNFSLFKDDFCSVNGYDEGIVGRGLEDDNLRERLKLSGAAVRSVTRVALQYHLFHESAPVPHDREAVLAYCYPAKAWADLGLVKG